MVAAFAACVALAACVFAAPAQGPRGGALIDLPVQFDGKYVLVPVSVGGRGLMFILDTAAGGSVISPATRDALGFTDRDGEISDIVGAGGTTKYQSLRVPSFAVGGHTREDFNVTVIDLKKFRREGASPYAGILGNDFLCAFDVEINLPASRLRLYPHGVGAPPRADGRAGVPNLASAEGFIALSVLVEGRPVEAIVDTAAPRSVVNWQAAKQAGVTLQTSGLRRREKGVGGLGAQVAETYLYRFERVEVGRVRFRPGEVSIADLSVFKALGLGEKPAMLFGLDMLKDRVLFVSFSTKQLYFSEPPPAR